MAGIFGKVSVHLGQARRLYPINFTKLSYEKPQRHLHFSFTKPDNSWEVFRFRSISAVRTWLLPLRFCVICRTFFKLWTVTVCQDGDIILTSKTEFHKRLLNQNPYLDLTERIIFLDAVKLFNNRLQLPIIKRVYSANLPNWVMATRLSYTCSFTAHSCL